MVRDVSDAEKQRMAAEMNLSETAFVVPAQLAPDEADVSAPEKIFAGRKRWGGDDA